VRFLWSVRLSAAVRGVALARERGWLLAWAADKHLTLFNASGARLADAAAPGKLVAVAAADDASAFVAVGADGQVWRFGPDLALAWERRLTPPLLAVAVEPFGQYVAVSDGNLGLHGFNADGRAVARATVARALAFLAYVPEQPRLIGSADFGLVAAFDLSGRVQWRDGLVANVGALAVSGAGEAVLACFSEGLCRYAPDGTRRPGAGGPHCRLAAVSYAGDQVLTAGAGVEVRLLGPGGGTGDAWQAPAAPAALALGALGTRAFVAAADAVVALETGPA
jgi:hypothetical protein